MFKDFIHYGRMLFQEGLIGSHSGNMSVRKGDTIYITRTGARLGDLEYPDIVRVNMSDTKRDSAASVEVKVHRAIYQTTNAKAIVHAHPSVATALSFDLEEIIPQDAEGRFYLSSIPVLKIQDTIGTQGSVNMVPPALKDNRVVLVKEHGSFARGESLEEAYKYTSVLEGLCRILYIRKTFKGG